MAGRTITFDADDLIKDLDIIRRVQMPFVASWALNAMAPRIRTDLQQRMQSTFQNPVPFTTNSPRWGARGYKPWVRSDKTNLEMGFWISEDGAKGQPPSYYLYPQVVDEQGSKQVYVTRFTKRLRREGYLSGSQYMLAISGARLSSDLRNSYGNITPGQYTRILFAIGAMESPLRGYAKKGRVKDQIFIAPGRGGGRAKNLPAGIWRRKGDDFGMIFKTLPSPPNVTPKFDFYGTTIDLAKQYFPDLVQQKMNQVMGGR